MFRLPPYPHELNLVEPVWSHPKRSLANPAKHILGVMTALVKTRLRRLQYRPGLLGFLTYSGDLSPEPVERKAPGWSPSAPRLVQPLGDHSDAMTLRPALMRSPADT